MTLAAITAVALLQAGPIQPLVVYGAHVEPAGKERPGGMLRHDGWDKEAGGVWFVYSAPGTCETHGSNIPPPPNSYGWRVDLAIGEVRWTRLPGSGSDTLRSGSRKLTGVTGKVVLDTLPPSSKANCAATAWQLQGFIGPQPGWVPPAQASTKPKDARPVQIWAEIAEPGGRMRPVRSALIPNWWNGTNRLYFYSRPTVCEVTASNTRPAGEAYGWEVEVVRSGETPEIRWKRLPGAASLIESANGVLSMPARAPRAKPFWLDNLDGDSRLAQRRTVRELRALDVNTPVSQLPSAMQTQQIAELRAHMAQLEAELDALSRRVGDKHPDRLRVVNELLKVQERHRIEVLRVRDAVVRRYEEGLMPLQTVNGCNALTLALAAGYEDTYESQAARIIEVELWFIHRTPDGKETSQRQAVRVPNGRRADFYFDDLELKLKNAFGVLPIAVEVFGSIDSGMMQEDGKMNLTLKLTRRYVNKDTALGNWPKTGKMDYPLTIQSGEVVSFVLPPLEDDGGILLGHRFSLRMRIRPVGDEN